MDSYNTDMARYKRRINGTLGHPRSTRVLLPLKCLGEMQQAIKHMEQGKTEQNVRITEYEARLRALEEVNDNRSKMMRSSILSDFVKKICGKSQATTTPVQNSLGYDSLRLAIDAASINRRKLLKAEVDPK